MSDPLPFVTSLLSHPSIANLSAVVETGGPVVAILLGMSVIALAIILAKLWQFAAVGLGSKKEAETALSLARQGQSLEALSLIERSRAPLSQALARILRGQRRGIPEAQIREEVQSHCQEALGELRSWLKTLEVIAALAPLLGLLGTVLGMIEAFRQLEAAGTQVNPAILSGGIWEALLTTAVGIAVAIPAVLASNWLEGRVDRAALDMETVLPRAFTADLSDHASPSAAFGQKQGHHAGDD